MESLDGRYRLSQVNLGMILHPFLAYLRVKVILVSEL